MDVEKLTIVEASHLLKAKAISAVELTALFKKRIEETEPQIQAWAYVQEAESLRKAAEAADAGAAASPLFAIPYGVKDIIHVNGLPTEAGSDVLKGFVSQMDAAIARKLKELHAVLLGKTTTVEFANMGKIPPTCNPWNPSHTPGGSSTGSAAAVSSSMSLFTIGTQTSGSVIRPAVFNGVTALKPSYGSISKAGIIPSSWSIDTVGIFAKNTEDVFLVYNELNGRDPKDRTTWLYEKQYTVAQSAKRYKVGVIRDPYFEASDESMSAFYEAVAVLGKLGFQCAECRMPEGLDRVMEAHDLVVDAESAAYHRKTFETQKELFSDKFRQDLELGLTYSATEYLEAQNTRWEFQQKLSSLFETFDLLVTPATAGTAPKGLGGTGSSKFNKPFSTAGVPVLTFPIGYSETTGLPIGIQVIANRVAEQILLDTGLAFQHATDHHLKRPKF